MGIVYTTNEMTIKEFEQKVLREKVDPLHHSRRFWDDQRWIVENMASLLEHYSGQWIAVYDGKVVASSKDLAVVEEESTRKVGDTEIVTFFVARDTSKYDCRNRFYPHRPGAGRDVVRGLCRLLVHQSE
jgi:hypothetical protein